MRRLQPPAGVLLGASVPSFEANPSCFAKYAFGGPAPVASTKQTLCYLKSEPQRRPVQSPMREITLKTASIPLRGVSVSSPLSLRPGPQDCSRGKSRGFDRLVLSNRRARLAWSCIDEHLNRELDP